MKSALLKKIVLSVAALSMVLCLFSGCGNSSSKNGEPTDGKKRITIWEDETKEVLFSAIADYEAEHSDVSIVVSSQGETSLEMAISAGTAPDIIITPSDYVATYGKKGYFLDLTQYGAGDVKSLFTEECWNVANAVSDKIYSLPFDSNIINFVYNKDMFDAAGATVPKTYDEMITAANKIKAFYGSDGTHYAYTIPFDCETTIGYKAWGTFQYYWWLWRLGGDIFNADLTEPTINSTIAVDALQKLIDFKNNGLASDKYMLAEFIDGKVAMAEITTLDYFKSAVAGQKANFEVALMPTLTEGGEPTTGMGLYCYGVTTTSKNPEIAYDFVEFFCTNTEYQISYCKPLYFIPSLIEAQADPYYKTDTWKIILEQARYAKATPGVINWHSMDDAVYDAIQQAATGSKTPQAALDAANEQIKILME